MKYYSLRQAVKLTPLARETLARYLNRYQGAEWAKGVEILNTKRKTGKRYRIPKKWIKEFNKRYKEGQLSEYAIFKPEEIKYTLKDIMKYCEKHKITTVKQFIKRIN